MKLTFELEGAIAYLHPNHVDSERVDQSAVCLLERLCVCVCEYLFFCLFVCVCVKMCLTAEKRI